MKKAILASFLMITSTLAFAGTKEYCESLDVASVSQCVQQQYNFRDILDAVVKFRREYTADAYDVLYLLCADYNAKPEFNTIDWVKLQQCYMGN